MLRLPCQTAFKVWLRFLASVVLAREDMVNAPVVLRSFEDDFLLPRLGDAHVRVLVSRGEREYGVSLL